MLSGRRYSNWTKVNVSDFWQNDDMKLAIILCLVFVIGMAIAGPSPDSNVATITKPTWDCIIKAYTSDPTIMGEGPIL